MGSDAKRAVILARKADTPANGFRGFTISLVVSQPSTVDSLFETAGRSCRRVRVDGRLGLRR
jgi:hypothetical protein